MKRSSLLTIYSLHTESLVRSFTSKLTALSVDQILLLEPYVYTSLVKLVSAGFFDQTTPSFWTKEPSDDIIHKHVRVKFQ